jgi:ATP-binding cassette subfamily B protein
MQNTDKAKLTFAFYWRHVRIYPRYLAGVLMALPITVLINGYLPALIVSNVLSRLSAHHYIPRDLWHSFGPQLIAYGVLLISGILCWRVVDMFSWRLEASVEKDLAEEVFSALLDKSADFHANNFGGSLVSKTNKLLGSYIRIADTSLYQTYPLISGLVITSVILAGRAPLFVALLVLFAVLFIICSLLVSKPVREYGARHAAHESTQTGYLADAIGNVMVIKSFARGRYERSRFARATTATQTSLRDVIRAHYRLMNSIGFLNRLISIAALVSAVISVLYFHANIGTMFLIVSYTSTISDQLFSFGNNALRNYNRSIGDAYEMIEILAEKPTVVDPAKPEPVRIQSGKIVFKDVSFTHDGAKEAIFHRFNVRIQHGEKVGLVGHSGSGKTTFTRLLLRFSDIDSGEILLDGQNIARITQDDLHANIAYVPQEPLLFHRSIAENIAYGQPDADIKTIQQIAKKAHAAEFIDDLPQAYETLVGERGVKLSGGQRQRVAIARAMLKNAPILVLDEATSALDSESEGLVQDALWQLMEGRTAIVIAHRLSTIQKMDRIIVLDDGKIVEEGSHKELIQKGGTYAKLWARQSGGFIDE